MRYLLFFLLPIFGCSHLYVNSVTISHKEINSVKIDSTLSGKENIRKIQESVAYQTKDILLAIGSSIVSGYGLGSYESKNFYAPNAYQKSFLADSWYSEWANLNTSGNAWLKVGDYDKVHRTLWLTFDKYAWNKYLKFFSGNWLYAYLSHFIVSNSMAGLVRNLAKHGTFYWSLEIDTKILEKIFE